MAATNYSPIQLYYSTTASAAPAAGNLVSGELAINITDGKLYYKDNAGAVQLLSTSTTANGTANGVLYLNGSKVATSGSALTFDGTTLGVTGGFKTFNSSAGGPVDSIYTGTTAGSVLGQFRAYSTGAGVTAESSFRTVLDGGSITSANFQWLLNNAEQMRLNSTGLGIGTSSPSEKLTVAGAGLFTGALSNYRTNAGAIDYFGGVTRIWGFGPDASTAGIIDFHTTANDGSPDNTMRFDASGNLGLGVTPSAWNTFTALQIASGGVSLAGSSGQAYLGANWYFASGNKYISNGYATRYDQYNGQHIWNTAASGTAGNAITFTQAMTLDASGNLLIGRTSSGVGGYKLQIDGAGGIASSANSAIEFGIRTPDATYNDSYLIFGTPTYNRAAIYCTGSAANTGNLVFTTYNAGSGAERARIDSSGNLLVGTTSAGGTLTNNALATVGISSTYNGTTSTSTGTAATIFTAPTNNGAAYLLTASIIGVDYGSNYTCVGILRTSGTGQNPSYTALVTTSVASVTISGANVQYTQNSGVAQTANWSILRIV